MACSAVAGQPDCCPIVVVQSPLHNCTAAVIANTVVAILLLVIAIASSLSSASHRAIASCLLACPSSASSPVADCCIASPHAAASHLPGASASHCTITSCHAPLVPLVQLIDVSPLLTLPPPIVPVVISAVITVIGGGKESSPSLPLSASLLSSFIVIVQLIVAFAGAVVSSVVAVTIKAIALGVPIIVAITSDAALSLTAIATSVITVLPTLSSSTSFCKPYLCSFAVNWRNRIKPRHSDVDHDVWLERLPLDVQIRGQQCEYVPGQLAITTLLGPKRSRKIRMV
jgi:hypothetical protein